MRLPKYIKRLTGFSTAWFGISWATSDREAMAAQSFREGIIDDLKDFYPAPGNWSQGFESKLHAAIFSIETRVQKFRHFVPDKERNAFDSEWELFRSHGLNLTWEKCAAFTMYPTMRPVGCKSSKEVFFESAENLLKYGAET